MLGSQLRLLSLFTLIFLHFLSHQVALKWPPAFCGSIKQHPLQKILNLGMEEISFPHPVIGISELSTQMIVVKCLVPEEVLFLFLSVHHGVGGGASAF